MTIKTFTNIGTQLESLLKNLTYPPTGNEETGDKVFGSVLLGLPESDFKGFTFPLAVCYVKGADYDDTFGIRNMPTYIHSVIGVIVTGETRSRYEKITAIMDLLNSKFHDSDEWIKLNSTVRRTFIEDSALTIMPTGNDLASVAIFTLKHHVFKIE